MISLARKYILKNKINFSLLALASLFIWMISFINPYLNGKIINLFQYDSNIKNIFLLIILSLVLSLLNTGISFFKNRFIIKFKSSTAFNLNCDILDHIKKIDISEVKKYDATYLTERINNDSNTFISFFIDNIFDASFGIFTLGFSIYIIASISVKITSALILIFLPLYLFSYYIFKNKIKSRNFKVIENQSRFFYHLNEQVESIETIKIDSSFGVYKSFLENSFSKLLGSIMKFTQLALLSDSMKSIINILSYTFIISFSAIEILNKRMSIGDLLIVNSYFSMFTGQISFYISLGNKFQTVSNSYKRMKDLLNINNENNGNKTIEKINSIRFIDTSFAYEDKTIISNFNYEFKPGNIYCFTGLNGQGKSTLAKLLIGLLTPNISGKILFNDVDISDIDIYSLRKTKIAMLPQNFNLRNDSIYNNICLGLENVDLDKLNYLCDKLNLTKYLDTLEQGIHTNLVNESNNLSGGEKEKIGLIKTLMKDSEVLILDEPSTGLDIKSTYNLKLILKELSKNKIVIIITHDEDFAQIANFNLDINSTDNIKESIIV